MSNKTILVIPDTHAPFEHTDTLSFLRRLRNKYEPTHVVHLGDLIDAHALSRYSHDPDGYSAGDEHLACKPFLKKLYKMFPKVAMVDSNHSIRAYHKAFDAGIPKAYLRGFLDVIEAPKGWTLSSSVLLDGIKFIHGERCPANIQTVAKMSRTSICYGHMHSIAGIEYYRNDSKLTFAMATGSLIDRDAYAFHYAKLNFREQICGAGIIQNGVPTFIPLD